MELHLTKWCCHQVAAWGIRNHVCVYWYGVVIIIEVSSQQRSIRKGEHGPV